MNSLERVFTALRRQEPDRVPICEMFINEKVRHSICAGCTYFEFIEAGTLRWLYDFVK